MMAIPILIGILLAGPAPIHIPLLLAWVAAFLAFQAGSVWLKSRRAPRYFRPTVTYAALAVPPGVIAMAMRPELLWWAIPFAPLVAVAVWAAWTRNDRGIANDTATIIATGLMIPVAFHSSHPMDDSAWPWIWTVAVVVTAAFWGTIPHVKALIRERKNPAYAHFSMVFHIVGAVAVLALMAMGVFERATLGGWLLAATWVLLAVRAVWMPVRQQRIGLYKPVQIGVVELILSVLLALAFVL